MTGHDFGFITIPHVFFSQSCPVMPSHARPGMTWFMPGHDYLVVTGHAWSCPFGPDQSGPTMPGHDRA